MDPADSIARTAFQIERIGRLMRAREGEAGLNPAQWEALRYLGRANRFSRWPSAVAEFLAATKGTVSQTLIALESKGYVSKSVSKTDRRSALIEVTDAGWDLLERDDPMAHLLSALADLPPLHATLMAQALSRVLGAMLERNNRRVFAVCMSCRNFVRDVRVDRTEPAHQCRRFDAPLATAEAELICVEHEAA